MYQCSSCGGRLKFDIASQQLKCEYCSNLFDPYEVEDGPAATEKLFYDVTIFTCPQCGGEIYSTDETAAGFCSFCGASTMLESRLGKKMRPLHVIPFKQTQEDCKKEYAKVMRRAIFAPKELKDEKYIDSFRGIYMPYWKYHFIHNGDFAVDATKSYRRGDYIITDHYNITGNIDASYDGLTYDASSSFADNISECVAPYDLHQMQDFTPSYLSGFYADVSDVDAKTYERELMQLTWNESFEKIKSMRKFSSYSMSFNPRNWFHLTEQTPPELTMFPVWFLSYRKNDRISYATVNGQTGKLVLDLPIDRTKYILGSLILAVPIFIFLNMFFTLRPITTLVWAIILNLITLITYFSEGKSIKARETLSNDKGARGKIKLKTRQNSGSNWISFINIAAIILSIVIMFMQPVSDWYYYGCVIISLFAELILIMDVITRYNLLATRPLPQFNHKGGDDHA